MLAPTGKDKTDGIDRRSGTPFDSEQRIGDLPPGWWAVDCCEVPMPGGETIRLFDSVGPMPEMADALSAWREGRGTVGSVLMHVKDGSVVELAKIA